MYENSLVLKFWFSSVAKKKRIKMVILKRICSTFDMCGILYAKTHRPSIRDIFHRLLFTSPFVFVLISGIGFLVIKAKDVNEITQVIYTICVFFMLTICYSIFLFGANDIRMFMDELENLRESSWKYILYLFYSPSNSCFTFVGRERSTFIFYQTADDRSNRFTKWFLILTFLSGSGSYIIPLIPPVYHYYYGTYSPDVWVLPYPIL